VATSKDDERRGPSGRGDCPECGAACVAGQRYCLTCGARRGPLPGAVATQLMPLLGRQRARGKAGVAAAAGAASAGAAVAAGIAGTAAATAKKAIPRQSYMPSPRTAVVAVMCMLAFGVVIGSATSQLAQSAGLSSIILEVSPPPPEPEAVETAAAEPEAEAEEPEPVEAVPSSAPAEVLPQAEPEVEPEPAPEPAPPPELPEPEGLPEVKHVFVITLGENGYEETFGATSTAPYLAKELPAQGELLPNYFAVTQGDLANQVALISGQGPTTETAANCPNYGDVVPGTLSAEGQVEGNGCVYPATTPTLPEQLLTAGLKWKAYVEDSGNGALAGQPLTCRHPASGMPDPSQVPVPGDAYLTWRNPFVYFHSIVDRPDCAETDVGLDRLAPDLQKKVTRKTPALSYIVPNACHAGGEAPCEPGRLAGPAAVEEFLKTVVPQIQASSAYEDGGLIAITSSQARQVSAVPGFLPDATACCLTPTYPNLPEAAPVETTTDPVKPSGGGGKVGLVLLSPFVEPGTVNETAYYNHYSLLRTIEELFELEPIGYAAEPALVGFEEGVFNAAVGEEELPPAPRHRFWLSRAGSAAR
jgi:phosphatidylinositol-3-phosphatase